MSPPFFDRSKLPEKLDDVCRDFPFPLAVTYRRVWEEIDADQPIPATLQLKDAFEALLKFLAAASVADCLSADPGREAAGKLVEKLFKPLTDGEWYSLLFDSLKVAKDDPAHASRRTWPQLADLLFKPNGDATDTRNTLIGTNKKVGFVKWRNSELGHGAFRRDRQHYAAQVVEWLPKLNACLTALRPLLDGRRLRGIAPDGQPHDWTGDGGLPHVAPHTHTPWGEPIVLTLDGPDGRSLAFGPLLTMQTCSQPTCRQPAAFFFEGNEFKDPKHKTYFLEYFLGHTQTVKDWPAVRDLARHLPDKFEFRRDSYDHAKLAEAVKVVFRDAATEYVRPDYLLDDFWALRDSRPTGYYLWEGEQGVGKSYLVHGLDEDGGEKGVTVLRYHILPGDATRYQTFIVELAERQREKLRMTTQQVQTLVNRHAELPKQFAAFVKEVMTANQLSGLIVAIDALDELRDPASPTDALITDFLPPPAELPKGCVIALTTRPTVAPRVRSKLDALGIPAEARAVIDPKSPKNRAAVAKALTERRVEGEEALTPEKAERLVELAGGVFLYAGYFARALAVNAYAGLDDLPPPEQFFADFLRRLGERVGESLFATVYMRTLMLLTAARTPVTRQQLVRWGVPADRLQFAFQDLREFVHELRHRDFHEGLSDDAEPRYKIAHEAFVRFVETHEVARLKDAHRTIASVALRHNETQWKDLDTTDDCDLYDVRFVLTHCDAAGMMAEAEALSGDDVLARGVWRTAYQLGEAARYHLAVELYNICEQLCRLWVELGRGWLTDKLADVLKNKGVMFWRLSKLRQAMESYDEAITILRRMVTSGRAGPYSNLAMVLVNKGIVLDNLSQLRQAMECYDEAITILRRMVTSGRRELDNELANAFINKGLVFYSLGQVREAVGCYDEAITILRGLVTTERGELALALVNKGISLDSLGQLREAVGCYDEAIVILRGLFSSGRWELENGLATGLMNKGNVLRHLGQLTEAVGCYDEAILIRRRLVESGRAELANDLAMAVMNKGNVLVELGEADGAAECFYEGMGLFTQLFQSGHLQTLPNLLQGGWFLLDLAVTQAAWSMAANLLEVGLRAFMAKQNATSITLPDQNQLNNLLASAFRLSVEQREHLLAASSPDLAEFLRTNVFDDPPPE